MAERRAVAAKVAGSKPVGHPKERDPELRGPSLLYVRSRAPIRVATSPALALNCEFILKLRWRTSFVGRPGSKGLLRL